MAQTRLETRLTARDETARAFRTLQSNLNTVNTAFANVAKIAAGLGVVFSGVFVRDLISVNKQFQSLKASLITFTGSIENADRAFGILREFAKSTPFSLGEVVSSFNILVAQGIRPTQKQLTSFADIAGGTSKSIEQFAEAVADASVGEFERLKEFGIKASKEGDKLTLSIGNYTKQINNDSDSILEALAEIGQLKFAGGAARQADTLGGAMTNLRDTFEEFLYSIGEQGFSGELTKAIKVLTAMISGNDKLAKSISDKLSTALYAMVAAVRFVVDNLDTLLMAMQIAFGVAVIRKVINTGKAVIQFGKSVINAVYATKIFSSLMGGGFTGALKKGAKGMLTFGATALLLTEGLEQSIEELGKNIDITSILDSAYRALGLTTLNLEDRFNELVGGTEMLDNAFMQNNGTLTEVYNNMVDADGGTKTLTSSTKDLTAAFEAVKKRIDPFGAAIASTKDEATVLKAALDAGKITNQQYEASLNAMAREALGLDNTMDELKTRQVKVEAAFKAGILTTAEYEKAISDIKGEIIDYNAENQKTYGSGAIKGIKDYYNSISDNAKNATDFVAGAFGGLEKSMSDFFYTGDLNFGTFVDAIKRGLADLAAKAVVSVGLNFLGKVFPNLQFADGGLVPGSGAPRADDVLARVSSGEYVIKASSVSKFGTGFFDALNAGRMPDMGGGGFSIDSNIMENMTSGFFLGGLIKGVVGIVKGVVGAVKSVIGGVMDAISGVVGAIADTVKGLVGAIVDGDLLSIASFALPFILPGVGAAISANLMAGSGFVSAVGSGISSSFAAGVLGAGNISAIATSVGIEFAKGAVIDQMSSAIAEKVIGVTDGMASAGSAYEKSRADRFGKLYQDAAPYLAGMTGTRFNAGDNVRVGERGEELLIPGRNGSVAPIKGSANDLIDVVKDMKEEIVMLRRQMSRVIAGGQLSGARS